jgi:hypothetical protein
MQYARGCAQVAPAAGWTQSSRGHCATEFNDLLAELLAAADCLRGIPAGAAPDAELAIETSEYRNNRQRFGRSLPWVQGRLLVQKARLQTLQTHMTAAKAWARPAERPCESGWFKKGEGTLHTENLRTSDVQYAFLLLRQLPSITQTRPSRVDSQSIGGCFSKGSHIKLPHRTCLHSMAKKNMAM